MRSSRLSLLVVVAIMLLAMAASPVAAKNFGAWAPAQSLESLVWLQQRGQHRFQ